MNYLITAGHRETRDSMGDTPLKYYAMEYCQKAACCRVSNFKETEKDLKETGTQSSVN